MECSICCNYVEEFEQCHILQCKKVICIECIDKMNDINFENDTLDLCPFCRNCFSGFECDLCCKRY